MRLTNEQVMTIKNVIRSNFGKSAKLILFGSRRDDNKRGGDIDLLVEANLNQEEMFMKKITALGQLQRALGEQKIDLLTVNPTSSEKVADVVQIAREQGLNL